jgi:ribosomal protein S18 acetylase RimI-like enzyme
MTSEIINPKISSDKLELFLKTNFIEALKDSSLRSFSFSDLVQTHVILDHDQSLNKPAAVLLFREIEPKKLAEIDFIATSANFKRRGLAGKLIRDLSSKYTEIWLELSSDNLKALSLYQKHGFSQQGTRPDYYGKGLHAVNMVKTRGG